MKIEHEGFVTFDKEHHMTICNFSISGCNGRYEDLEQYCINKYFQWDP